MNLFSKYLPIEGEIREGDMVKTMGETMRPFKEGMNKPQYQKYALHLCSRDIQVGDKVWDTINECYVEVTSMFTGNTTSGPETKCWYLKDKTESGYRQFHEDSLLVKVIGLISPEAKWVTEGMEFTEEQIRKFHHIWGNNEDFIYLIQCPTCLNYH